ncbi:MAG: hypothetical protein ACF8GE_09905 [Phycisphaerales bacterium JB043]
MPSRLSVRAVAPAVAVILAAGASTSLYASSRLSAETLDDGASSLRLTPQTISVDSGESLTPVDLANGSFMGEVFTLGPDLTFEVNSFGSVNTAGIADIFDFNGSTVNIRGLGRFESFHSGPEVRNVTINLRDLGFFGRHITGGGFTLGAGAELNLFDDSYAINPTIGAGATVRTHGGRLDGSVIQNGGTLETHAGDINAKHIVQSGGDLQITGGRWGVNGIFEVQAGGSVSVTGGHFSMSATAGTLALESTLTSTTNYIAGVLQDGSLLFATVDLDYRVPAGSLSIANAAVPAIDTTPININSGDVGEGGLLPGQTLNVSGTAVIRDDYQALGATINLLDGAIGRYLHVADTHVNVSGGTLRADPWAFGSSVIDVSGGQVHGFVRLFQDSQYTQSNGKNYGPVMLLDNAQATIAGGELGMLRLSSLQEGDNATAIITGGLVKEIEFFHISPMNTVIIEGGVVEQIFTQANTKIFMHGGMVKEWMLSDPGTEVVITGGTVEHETDLSDHAVLNIHGGTFDAKFNVVSGSALNLFVQSATLEGIELDFTRSESIVINARDGSLLEAVLESGELLQLTLNAISVFGEDRITTDSTLTVTLVPTPSTLAPLTLGALALSRRRRAVA